MNDNDFSNDDNTNNKTDAGDTFTTSQDTRTSLKIRQPTYNKSDITTASFISKFDYHHLVSKSSKDNSVYNFSKNSFVNHNDSVMLSDSVILTSHQILKNRTLNPTVNFPEKLSVTERSLGLLKSVVMSNVSDSYKCTTLTQHDYVVSTVSAATEPKHSSGIADLSQIQLKNETAVPKSLVLADLLLGSFHDVSTGDYNLTLSLNSSRCAISSNGSSLINIRNDSKGCGDFLFEDYEYDYNSEDTSPPLDEILPVSLLYGFTLMIGVVGNLLVIAAVARDRRLRSITNLFLTSLASADLALLCFCVPVKCVAFFSFSWAFGFFLCKSVHYVQIVAMVCSVMTLTVMSIERNIAILFPLRSKRICTRSRAKIVVVLLWAGSILLALPILAGQRHQLVGMKHKAYWCIKEWDTPLYGILFESYMLVLLFLVPVTVMVVCYTTICLELSRGIKFRSEATSTMSTTTYRGYTNRRPRQGNCSKQTSQNGGCRESMLHSRHKERMDQEKMKVIRMLIVVVVLFAICWGPILINNLLVAVEVLDKLHIGHLKPLRQTMFLLSYLNSSLNPLVYGFMSRHFRRGFREAIYVCCSSNERRSSENRLGRCRKTNNVNCYSPYDANASTIRTGTIRLSPVTDPAPVAIEEDFDGSPVGGRRYGRRVWARNDRASLSMHDM